MVEKVMDRTYEQVERETKKDRIRIQKMFFVLNPKPRKAEKPLYKFNSTFTRQEQSTPAEIGSGVLAVFLLPFSFALVLLLLMTHLVSPDSEG